MRKKSLTVLMFGSLVCVGAFSQNIQLPNTLGIGLSLGGMGGGDWAYSLDLTGPYLHLWGNGYLALRLAGDLMAKEGILVGSTTDTLTWPAYFGTRLGIVLARVPNNYLRLYAEGGANSIFLTSNIASSLNPSIGLYVHVGSEFFVDESRHTALFLEVGDGGTFGNPSADKLEGSPVVGNGFSVMAGFRGYF